MNRFRLHLADSYEQEISGLTKTVVQER